MSFALPDIRLGSDGWLRRQLKHCCLVPLT